MKTATRRKLRSSIAGVTGGLTVLVLAGSLALPAAHADDLDNKQKSLEDQASSVQSSLEFLDGKIAKSAADLTLFQGQLPGAQQALSDAQGRVATATAEAESLAARLDAAQQSKARIKDELAQDQTQSAATKKLIGQIATQAYKSGGVPQDLSLLFGSTGKGNLADSIDMANQALRSQNAAMEQLNQKNAIHTNQAARLSAVEEQINDLKGQADAALSREQSARDEAAAKKAAVDKLVSDTTRLNKELAAQKPAIQAKLAQVDAARAQVAQQIKDRDERLRQEWLAEQARQAEAARQAQIAAQKAAEAAARAAAEEAARNNQPPPVVPPVVVPPPYVPPTPGNPSAFGIIAPFAGAPITSGWGWRLVPPGTIDFNGTGSYLHTGVDYGVSCGTPVRAAAAGTVDVAGWTVYGGGYTVRISHGVMQGNVLTTVYYHNSSVIVAPGQRVSQGQIIAYSGSTGNSTGCHAHFETWLNGSPVDPQTLL